MLNSSGSEFLLKLKPSEPFSKKTVTESVIRSLTDFVIFLGAQQNCFVKFK